MTQIKERIISKIWNKYQQLDSLPPTREGQKLMDTGSASQFSLSASMTEQTKKTPSYDGAKLTMLNKPAKCFTSKYRELYFSH